MNDVILFAKAQGYDSARAVGKWKGFALYEPIMKAPGARVGLPHFILVKGGEIRMTTPDEAFEIFDKTIG